MTGQEFVDAYLLTMEVKQVKWPENEKKWASTCVRYKIKIRSAILPGKLKTHYCMGMESKVELLDVLGCLQLDVRSGEYSLKEFLSEFGYEDYQDGIDVHAKCVEQKDKLLKFFGIALTNFLEVDFDE